MQFCHVAHQRQPQPSAGIFARQAGIQLGERAEEARNIAAGNANAGVPHAETNILPSCIRDYLQPNLTVVRGEFDSVAQQIHQHLLDAAHVGLQGDDSRRNAVGNTLVFLLCQTANQVEAGLADVIHRQRLELWLHQPSFGLCYIQNIVDQPQQVFATGAHRGQGTHLAFV